MKPGESAGGGAGSARVAQERQQTGPAGFLRAAQACAWLEYRNLRQNPTSLLLNAIQAWTLVGVWYFVSDFLSPVANSVVRQEGGNYVSFVLVAFLLNQSALAALLGPFATISDAFWDKRLETYRLAAQGIWANLVGRLAWKVLFATILQGMAAGALVAMGLLRLGPDVPWLWVAAVWGLLLLANAGLGLVGASLFFLLEVKSGQDPVTWIYQYWVQIVSGLYIPLAILPTWLRATGTVLPQTYAFAVMRNLVLTGHGLHGATGNLVGLGVSAAVTAVGGMLLVNLALRRAERESGLGVVV